MFNAKADRERLGFNIDATFVDHLKGIARAVAQREHQVVSFQAFTTSQHDALYLIVFNFNVINTALETNFATERSYGVAHVFHHADQPERAYMRMADI